MEIPEYTPPTIEVRRQKVVRLERCMCGCHGEDHKIRCHRTVHDAKFIERRVMWVAGLFICIRDATGWVRYCEQDRTVYREISLKDGKPVPCLTKWILGDVIDRKVQNEKGRLLGRG